MGPFVPRFIDGNMMIGSTDTIPGYIPYVVCCTDYSMKKMQIKAERVSDA